MLSDSQFFKLHLTAERMCDMHNMDASDFLGINVKVDMSDYLGPTFSLWDNELFASKDFLEEYQKRLSEIVGQKDAENYVKSQALWELYPSDEDPTEWLPVWEQYFV